MWDWGQYRNSRRVCYVANYVHRVYQVWDMHLNLAWKQILEVCLYIINAAKTEAGKIYWEKKLTSYKFGHCQKYAFRWLICNYFVATNYTKTIFLLNETTVIINLILIFPNQNYVSQPLHISCVSLQKQYTILAIYLLFYQTSVYELLGSYVMDKHKSTLSSDRKRKVFKILLQIK